MMLTKLAHTDIQFTLSHKAIYRLKCVSQTSRKAIGIFFYFPNFLMYIFVVVQRVSFFNEQLGTAERGVAIDCSKAVAVVRSRAFLSCWTRGTDCCRAVDFIGTYTAKQL